jgi:AcrR family transcriptional regulator
MALHMKREERISSILDATRDLLLENGVEAATITAIAGRSRVSRQWLYELFPDVESILTELYARTRAQLFATFADLQFDDEASPRQRVLSRTDLLMEMPEVHVRFLAYFLNSGLTHSRSVEAVRANIYEDMEAKWVTPFLPFGLDRDLTFGSIISILQVALTLRIATFDGHISAEAAAVVFQRTVNAHLDSSDFFEET